MGTSKFFLGASLAMTLGACSSMDDIRVMKFAVDATVSQAGGGKTDVKKGDTMPLPNVPSRVESPGHISMIVVPVIPGSGEVDISLKPVEEWGGPQLEKSVNSRLNARLNSVLIRVIDAQKRLQSGKARDALAIIDDLQLKDPGLTYLNFLKSSCLIVLGDKDRARGALEIALRDFPDDESGRALAESLGVEGSRGASAKKNF